MKMIVLAQVLYCIPNVCIIVWKLIDGSLLINVKYGLDLCN